MKVYIVKLGIGKSIDCKEERIGFLYILRNLKLIKIENGAFMR
jgi:hypothetical protein